MIGALVALKRNRAVAATPHQGEQSVAAFKIESRKGQGFGRFFSTHPDLDSRIARLKLAP